MFPRLSRPVWAGVLALTLAGLLTSSGPAFAQPPAFRFHEINPESTYSACAVLDVNGNGKLDIVCGGWWYEAPTWKKHFLRDVEIIRGRYDDYSNLPLDVTGNGRPDLISANYRSQTLYWIEHPGPGLGPWKAHVIAKPGPMETARLYDVSGNGRLDVLPNGVQFAAWWELVREDAANGEAAVRWLRHELPRELAGHGVGFGDINGDGRGDVVGPNGWAEAPPDPRRERWRWHPEFKLHRDASIPILVYDVDGDGDNDIVWGRGHNTGLYWLEQVQTEDGGRDWVFHVIDTSWSQPHSLLLGDIDGDGRPELIAGKRYLGHDGKDTGEYDPMMICAYKFHPETKTWSRNVISEGGRAGFGLDPKLIDLDGDGDLDIVCAGRSGLYVFENLLISDGPSNRAAGRSSQKDADVNPAFAYDDHSKLLVYKDDSGADREVKTHADWGRRRAHTLKNMQRVMGELPDSSRRTPLDVQVVETVSTPKYVRHSLTYASEPGDRVPAYLLVPHNLRGRAPALLCLHQTTKIGKGEPAGLGGLPTLHYAHELAERGYVCLVPDYPSFGDYDYDFARPRDQYLSGTMKAIWNNVRALDLLESLPQVDRDRIGCIGHSLGGHNTLFTAAFDLRIKAAVTSCGFTAFHHYYGGKLAGWTSDRYMPRIRDDYHNDPGRVPFDFYEVLAALAPRAVFVNAPTGDGNFDVGGVRKVMSAANQVYTLTGGADRLHAVYPDTGHTFPDEVREDCYRWLEEMLK